MSGERHQVLLSCGFHKHVSVAEPPPPTVGPFNNGRRPTNRGRNSQRNEAHARRRHRRGCVCNDRRWALAARGLERQKKVWDIQAYDTCVNAADKRFVNGQTNWETYQETNSFSAARRPVVLGEQEAGVHGACDFPDPTADTRFRGGPPPRQGLDFPTATAIPHK